MKNFLRIFVFLVVLSFCFLLCGCDDTLEMENIAISMPSAAPTVSPAILPMDDILGTWIASVSNIDFPSSPGLDEAALIEELDKIVRVCEKTGINTIFFQVRPTSDALYRSDIFPLSTYLTGGEQRFATDDDFDPLAYLIAIAHAKNIAVHAWVNPMRISLGSNDAPNHDTSIFHSDHPARLHPEYVVRSSDGNMYYNVGYPGARDLIADGVREIVSNYDVDGVVFDDYFYPYSGSFNDTLAYKIYGGGMNLEDFRRDSVNKMIELCGEIVSSCGKDILFGVSPFGIWQNAKDDPRGSDTSGLNAYNTLFCDALTWAKNGYVDYIAPQLYWTNETKAAPYDVLCKWWSENLEGTGCAFMVAHSAHRYNIWENPQGIATYQYEYASYFDNYRGSIFYGYSAIRDDINGIRFEIFRISKEKMEN